MKVSFLIILFSLFFTACLDTDGTVAGSSRVTIDELSFPQGHYFVHTSRGYNGDLGGLEGANKKCFDNLQLHYWSGKENFVRIFREQVRAFLCTSEGCQNPLPNTAYQTSFSNTDTAGLSFTTNSSGAGPGVSTAGLLTNDYWTGRSAGPDANLWPDTAATDTCNNWTDSSSSGMAGTNSEDNQNRWGHYTLPCNEFRTLICIVDPI